ncbi:MAG: L-threonylcarbamoyladenylate synthase [Bacteroidota bacterium]
MMVKQIADCLLQEGVVLLPTDTVYGLAVSPQFPKAVDRLFELKQRERHKNLPIMVADIPAMEQLGVAINARARRLLESEYVPGALTVAIGFTTIPTVAWLEGREEVAIRIPDDEQLLAVLRATGPLLVTSANASGYPVTPPLVADILPQLHGKPDLVVEGGSIKTIPSTLVNCRKDPPQIEREGAIPTAAIEAILDFV